MAKTKLSIAAGIKKAALTTEQQQTLLTVLSELPSTYRAPNVEAGAPPKVPFLTLQYFGRKENNATLLLQVAPRDSDEMNVRYIRPVGSIEEQLEHAALWNTVRSIIKNTCASDTQSVDEARLRFNQFNVGRVGTYTLQVDCRIPLTGPRRPHQSGEFIRGLDWTIASYFGGKVPEWPKAE